jgi:hypothetical protein
MENDARKITTSDLLHMNSVYLEESYDKICDATQMLFQANMGQTNWIKRRPMSQIHWNYSSGLNLLSYILRNQFKTHQEYLTFGMLS